MKWPNWFVDYVEGNSLRWAKIPTVKWGFVRGPTVRLEKNGGGEMFLSSIANQWLKNYLPDTVDGYAVTHLQYQSKWGILRMSPFCFYFWYRFRPQQEGKPGTELAFTFRIGKGRWEAGRGIYIKPTLQAGLHYD